MTTTIIAAAIAWAVTLTAALYGWHTHRRYALLQSLYGHALDANDALLTERDLNLEALDSLRDLRTSEFTKVLERRFGPGVGIDITPTPEWEHRRDAARRALEDAQAAAFSHHIDQYAAEQLAAREADQNNNGDDQ